MEHDEPPRALFGSAKHPQRFGAHPRPHGLDDATVEALGALSAALEIVEHARGLLYAFHRHTGMADLALQDAVHQLRAAGHAQIADELDDVLVGRDTVAGMWTFELVESYDADYWSVFRSMEARARAMLGNCEPHVYEAEMKVREQQGS